MANSTPKKESNASLKPSKIVDVARPEETLAQATSRPVIVGHTNMIQKDPMVSVSIVQKDDGSQEESLKIIENPSPERTIQPVSGTVANESVEENTSIEDEEIPQTSESKSSETAVVDALISEVKTKRDRLDEADNDQKLNDEVHQMISSKKYYVKIRTPANKRNVRFLSVLVLLALLGAGGWYFGFGPGKDAWSEVDEMPLNATSQNSPLAASDQKPATTLPVNEKAVFSNRELGISFSYPKSWKVEVAKDPEFSARDIVTLVSPVESIKTANNGVPSVEVEAFLRTKIFVENTTNTREYTSDLVSLPLCSSEDIVVGNANLKLLFYGKAQQAPNISTVSLSPTNCTPTGSTFSANDQLQFGAKKDTYIMYAEYILGEAYLKKNGTTDKDAIALAQEAGIVATKADVKKAKAFTEFIDVIKSFKEL